MSQPSSPANVYPSADISLSQPGYAELRPIQAAAKLVTELRRWRFRLDVESVLQEQVHATLVVFLLGLKASQSQGIVDPLSGPQEVHTDESRIRKLAEQFLARQGERAMLAAE